MQFSLIGYTCRVFTTVSLIGGSSRWGGDRAVMIHYHNEVFEELALLPPVDELTNLFKVSHDGMDYWSVGAQGALLKNIEAIPTGLATDLITIAPNQSGLVVVGGRGTGVTFDIAGGSMGDVTQIPAGLNGVSSLGDTTLMVGERGYALLQEGEESQDLLSITLDVLHATLVDTQGNYYAVGGNLFTAEAQFHGVLLRYGEVQ